MSLKAKVMLLASLAALSTPSLAQQNPAVQTQAQSVGVDTLALQAVPLIYDLPGRVVAYQQVDIRPRVDGMITELLYTPGNSVEAGSPLFRIDDASYRASLASAESDLLKAKAELPVAQDDYNRANKLKGSGYTEAEVESYAAALDEAKAELDAAQAARDYAATELSWTTVNSPISGWPEVSDVSVGDLVTAGQSDALTTVTRLDPIDVTVTEASSRILEIRKKLRDGSIKPGQTIKITLTLDNGDTYSGNGKIVAPSATVSSSTGSLDIRFRFENTSGYILPGMFVRGHVELGTIEAFLVPQRATSRDTTGVLTAFIVADDNTAKQITLTEEGSYENSWIVTSGINPGDKLILDGLKSLKAGQSVAPVPAHVDETGLVVDEEAGSSEAGMTEEGPSTATTTDSAKTDLVAPTSKNGN